ncbi:MAG: single-stranded-DNA-specific exonuclease RecJ [Tenericutes bacterium HGW-Tenericutes-1]|jgi:single-stranded-DNA-specific exonuclease|nr:MAG: single-stranded-DNA-specific exonuclease RecJ [Tenericutes bacterium HGW-Tenericutes-1]
MLKAKYGWELSVDGIVADQDIFNHILKNRGIEDADHFFNMGKESLHNPFLLEDMTKAVNRILLAISLNDPIIIYGDYDCDGITAISVLYRALKKLNANIHYDLPDRFSDGYGLNLKAVDDIIQKGYKLVITVDNGITCIDEVEKLQKAGIDCIITDHHEQKGILPPAFAIIHAKISNHYPWKELAGVAVAYKLAVAVLDNDLDELLDLVMIGTIADLMPLKDENQALVNLGLKQFQKTTHPGLKKLIQHSHLDQLNETAIAFKIAPKINSSGRLGKAKDAVQLLITDSDEEANRLILDIEQNHSTRKDLTEESFITCERVMNIENNVLVIASTELHEGIIGICAQKIAEKYQKSTIVINIDEEGIGKGSCRAFGQDNILEMLDASSDLLVKYGGHSQAAGLTIEAGKIPELIKRLNSFSKTSSQPILTIDMELKISETSLSTVKKLEKYSFFTGAYLFSHLVVVSKMILAQKHTKLLVQDDFKSFEAIIFNHLDYYYLLEPGDVIDIVGGLSINQWKSKESLQILIKDLRCQDFQLLDWRNYQENTLLPTLQSPTSLVIDDSYIETHLDNQKIEQPLSPLTIVIGPFKKANYINKLLSKDYLAPIYRLIQNKLSIERHQLYPLIGGNPWLVEMALKVFCEIGLIECIDNSIKILKQTGIKKSLDDSDTYRYLKKMKSAYDFYIDNPYIYLKKHFVNLLEV